jgi:hypothetical protein
LALVQRNVKIGCWVALLSAVRLVLWSALLRRVPVAVLLSAARSARLAVR